jgi:hypothetical protein
MWPGVACSSVDGFPATQVKIRSLPGRNAQFSREVARFTGRSDIRDDFLEILTGLERQVPATRLERAVDAARRRQRTTTSTGSELPAALRPLRLGSVVVDDAALLAQEQPEVVAKGKDEDFFRWLVSPDVPAHLPLALFLRQARNAKVPLVASGHRLVRAARLEGVHMPHHYRRSVPMSKSEASILSTSVPSSGLSIIPGLVPSHISGESSSNSGNEARLAPHHMPIRQYTSDMRNGTLVWLPDPTTAPLMRPLRQGRLRLLPRRSRQRR